MPPIVYFLCTGNLCRSPMAEAVFSFLAEKEQIPVDVRSAGFQPKLESVPYHPLATEVCESKGIKLIGQSKVFTREDLAKAQFVFLLDEGNMRQVFQLDPSEEYLDKVYYLREFSSFPSRDHSVPDPMGQPKEAFETSFRMILDCCTNLIENWKTELPPARALALSELGKKDQTKIHNEEHWLSKILPYLNGKSCLILGRPSQNSLELLSRNIGDSILVTANPEESFFSSKIETRVLRTSKIATIERQFDCLLTSDALNSIFPERLGGYLAALSELVNQDGVFMMHVSTEQSCKEWLEILRSYFSHVKYADSGPIPFFPFLLKKNAKNDFYPIFASQRKTSLNELIRAHRSSHTGSQ